MAQILVIVKPNGETTVEAVGYQGSACSLKTAPYINALGNRTHDLPKTEMFQDAHQHQELSQ